LALFGLLANLSFGQNVAKPFSVLAPSITVMPATAISDLAVGDVNRDGWPDYVLLSYPLDQSGHAVIPNLTSLVVMLGNGDGTFQSGVTVATFPVAGGDVAFADFNRDGKLDIAVMSGSTTFGLLGYTGANLYVFLGNGDGTFGKPIAYASTVSLIQQMFVADVNADGKPDLLAGGPSALGTSPGSGEVLLGNGDGTFQPPIPFAGLSVAVGDFNGDGKLDVVSNAGGELSVLLGRGDGTFGAALTISELVYGTSAAQSYQQAATGDFNGDGKLDLAIAQNPAGLVGAPQPVPMTTLLGNGDGTFQPAKSFAGPGGLLLAVDANQDGRLDLLANKASYLEMATERSVSLIMSRTRLIPVISRRSVSTR
jgi:hypothetical protein